MIKYVLAVATTGALSQSQAKMSQSSFTKDNDNSRLAARALNKEARSFNSSEKKTSKNYFVEKLEPGKKLNVNVAYVAEDKQLNEYKNQLYLMTVLSGNPLGEGTIQDIKSEK